MVAQCLRYEPHSRVIHQMIQEGEFGEIWSVRSDNFYAMVPPRSKVGGERSIMAGSWWMDGKRSGGGPLIAQTTHHLDLFRYYIGDAKRVTAASWAETVGEHSQLEPPASHSKEDVFLMKHLARFCGYTFHDASERV